jgi:transposase
MLTVSFDCEGIIHHEFLLQDQTVNKEYYLKVMQRLRGAVRRKRSEMWRGKKWLLHHDDAPVHSSLLIHDFLIKHEMKIVPQPPCSPDLAPADFLFTKLKSVLKV